jgi:DNA modification methylase
MMPNFKILQGDCRQTLKSLPDESVHCCVTSPPYFGLRDYGCEDQIGLEQTPDAFVEELVAVFREVKRVLRNDGTLWLNLGDSYVGATSQHKDGGSQGHNSCIAKKTMGGIPSGGRADRSRSLYESGLAMKQLIGIPWRVAFALQADGWYLRQDIIWHKPNPMPESVQDRCTKAHEYIFLLSKSARYFYDIKSVMEPVASGTVARLSQPTISQQVGSDRVPGKTNGNMKAVGSTETRNRRSVWTVTTKPYSGAHFATFPPDLIEPCILAGSPRGGFVLDPFGGSGTTAQVAMENNRSAILCELNPEYVGLINERLHGITPTLF